MPNMVDIEVRNQLGTWVRFSTVSNEEALIEAALQAALNSSRYASAREARAVHQSTKQVITELKR